jgi:rhomboid protease GluP
VEEATTNPPGYAPRAYATLLVLFVNIVIYIIMESQGGPTYENLVRFGAKENGLIALGEWYRLFTPMFLHAGLMHLGFNMYALYQVGRVLEYLIGPRNFLAIYVVGGLTATLCSFALSPPLSVGASGSLYAILLALYVIQRYEVRLAREVGLQVPNSPLGSLIIINGLITFIIPNIDWAAHLGGALAGSLLAGALISRHRWKIRMAQCRRYLDPLSRPPRRKMWEFPKAYFAVLGVINIIFCLKFFFVSEVDKAFGAGIQAAAEMREAPREAKQLADFGELITSDKSDASPGHLLKAAAAAHASGFYMPAFLGYHAALLIAENTAESLSHTEMTILRQLMDLTFKMERPEDALMSALGVEVRSSNEVALQSSGVCARAAELLETLRVYRVSAKLYECAYLLDTGSWSLAVKTFANLKRSADDSKGDIGSDLARFREIFSQLSLGDGGAVSELRPGDYWRWVEKPDRSGPNRNEEMDDSAEELPPI